MCGAEYDFHPTTPIRLPPMIPSPSKDGLQGSRSGAGLARQAEVLEKLNPRGQRRRLGHADAFVPNQHLRVADRTDHQQGFFKTGVEPRQIGEIGAVLAVGVHDEPVVAEPLHAGSQPFQTDPINVRGDLRHRFGRAKLGQRYFGQSCLHHHAPLILGVVPTAGHRMRLSLLSRTGRRPPAARARFRRPAIAPEPRRGRRRPNRNESNRAVRRHGLPLP